METTMKKTSSPIVREYKIGDITYIVKAVIKDGAKEDAVTKSLLLLWICYAVEARFRGIRYKSLAAPDTRPQNRL